MFRPARVRLALAVGDQELEWRLRPALEMDEELEIAVQCLSADQLLRVVESQAVDAVIVAWGLHRLTEPLLEQLDQCSVPVLFLVPDPADERWAQRRWPAMAVDADPKAVRAALQAVQRGERLVQRPRPSAEPLPVLKEADAPSPPRLCVIAVAGGAGSPGRTTVATSLAAALGAAAPTVLVDLDLSAPTVAAFLDRDPSRNICTLAHVVRESPHAWTQALHEELQDLNRHVHHGRVLCGLPKREMRSSVSPHLIERLVAELSGRFQFVILDVGEELLGTDAAAVGHRAALAMAQHVLVVATPDLIGLWHARVALKQFERMLQLEPQHASLVVNRHDVRYHHARAEIEWHLGAEVAALVPHDYAATQRAISEQRPLVIDPASRAARALIQLAERIHQGQIRLPNPEPAPRRRWSWPRWPARPIPTSDSAPPGQAVALRPPAASNRRGVVT